VTGSGENNPFAPATFFPLVAARLNGGQTGRASNACISPLGDHVLNPGFTAAVGTWRDAAVLVPIVARLPDAAMLLTVRTAHLATHAGQIAFPGGKIDPADASAVSAALREAEEEIGLDRRLVEPLGALDPYHSGTGYRIVPVVARVDPAYRLTLNPHEVESAFEVPLAFLMSPENHRLASRVLRGATRHFYEMPFGEHYIWGVTAGIIRGLYERVYG
jgi:8-oxo-dGTP pyrophosphatase MutT (NUDIX family)